MTIEEMDNLCKDDWLINLADTRGIPVEEFKDRILRYIHNNFHYEYEVLVKDENGAEMTYPKSNGV